MLNTLVTPASLPEVRRTASAMLSGAHGEARETWGCVQATDLYYVREDFTTLLEGALSAGMEEGAWEETIGAFAREAQGSFIFLEKPVIIPAHDNQSVDAQFIIWTRLGDDILVRAMGSHAKHGDDRLVPVLLASLSVLDWRSKSKGDRWLLACAAVTFSLLSQGGLVDVSEVVPPALRSSNAKKRKSQKKQPPVRVVDLRRSVSQGITDVEQAERTYRNRWIVRGHWRSQAHGPGRALRRRVYIAPHVKGPEGAPLLQREAVYRW